MHEAIDVVAYLESSEQVMKPLMEGGEFHRPFRIQPFGSTNRVHPHFRAMAGGLLLVGWSVGSRLGLLSGGWRHPMDHSTQDLFPRIEDGVAVAQFIPTYNPGKALRPSPRFLTAG